MRVTTRKLYPRAEPGGEYPLYELLRDWERFAERADLFADLLFLRIVVFILERFDHKFRDAGAFFLLEPARGYSRRAEADAGRVHGLPRIVRDRVLIERNPDFIEHFFRFLAGDRKRAEYVRKQEVIISTASEQPNVLGLESGFHRFGVLQNLSGIRLERRHERLPEAHRFPRDVVHVRTPLESRKDGLIFLFGDLLALAREYHAATRTAQRLVGGRGKHVESKIKRVLRRFPRDETSDMRDIHNRVRPYLARDGNEFFIIQFARICGKSRKHDFWLRFHRHGSHLVVVDLASVRVLHLVADENENLFDVRYGMYARQMPAVREVHAEHGVARIKECEVHADIR